MNIKEKRALTAQETVDIFRTCHYSTGNIVVDISGLHQVSMKSTKFYPRNHTFNILIPKKEMATKYSFCNEGVVDIVKRLADAGKSAGVLNFASAKNPGGGFLNGAIAQEESLAACSNLYLTQIKPENMAYYETNRQCGTALYTDCMIYSKDVVFIRDGNYSLVKPYTSSILTAPAVNMGAYLSRNEGSSVQADTVMKNRMRKVLQAFAENGDRILILGAYGCGVFRNNPHTVGCFFRELLRAEIFENCFDEVIFAVLDTSKDKRIYNEFKAGFGVI